MINFLISRMIAQLDADFNGTGTPNIVQGPVNPPTTGLPQIVLSPGKLEMPPPFGDIPPGQMQPRETMDTFPVNTVSADTIRGPYTLSQSALGGSVSCRFNWKQAGDDLEGKKQRVYPRINHQGDGFEIDFATREVDVFYAASLPGVPTLEVEYNYPAVFTLREFQQILVLETFAANPIDAEKWAALATAVLTSRTSSLLDDANNTANFHSSGNYVARSLFNTFYLTDGSLDHPSDNVFRYSLNFNITGQFIPERTFTDNVEVIRKIFSPGHKGDPGTINIEVNLD
jgi:hypothetical protein